LHPADSKFLAKILVMKVSLTAWQFCVELLRC